MGQGDDMIMCWELCISYLVPLTQQRAENYNPLQSNLQIPSSVLLDDVMLHTDTLKSDIAFMERFYHTKDIITRPPVEMTYWAVSVSALAPFPGSESWSFCPSASFCTVVSSLFYEKVQFKHLKLWLINRMAYSKEYMCPLWKFLMWLPTRKCDYRTDTHIDGQRGAGQSDPYVPLCFAGNTKRGSMLLW